MSNIETTSIRLSEKNRNDLLKSIIKKTGVDRFIKGNVLLMTAILKEDGFDVNYKIVDEELRPRFEKTISSRPSNLVEQLDRQYGNAMQILKLKYRGI